MLLLTNFLRFPWEDEDKPPLYIFQQDTRLSSTQVSQGDWCCVPWFTGQGLVLPICMNMWRIPHLTALSSKQFKKNVRLVGQSKGQCRKDWSVRPLSGDYRLQAVLAGFPKLESNLFISLLNTKERVSSLHSWRTPTAPAPYSKNPISASVTKWERMLSSQRPERETWQRCLPLQILRWALGPEWP